MAATRTMTSACALLSGFSTPEAFRALIKDESRRWGPVARSAGLQ